MFFVNGDLNKEVNQKSLSDVIADDKVKVAYGVLSLKNYINMVQHIGGSDKIYIPKVQRGLVWEEKDKDGFIENCILGVNGVTEPMPNIFLFYNQETKDIQLFDGLQRTSAILSRFKDSTEIKDDLMIPAALFKGSRTEAESLFRNINEKGVKLSTFEKLASLGGSYEVDSQKFSDFFKEHFDEFVDDINKKYKQNKLKVTLKEKSTIYEMIVFIIYNFSKSENYKKIFMSNKNSSKYYSEVGFQILYSVFASINGRKTIGYTSDEMMDKMIDDAAKFLEYDPIEKTFDENKVWEIINNMEKAITQSEMILRKILNININSKNKNSKCYKALASSALVGSLVVYSYINEKKMSPDHREQLMYWYIRMLVEGKSSSNTNKIVDDLLSEFALSENDKLQKLNDKVKKVIGDEPNAKNHENHLWTLMWLYWDVINQAPTANYDIDHIFPKAKLKAMGVRKESINNIANLELLISSKNKSKGTKYPHECTVIDDKWVKELFFETGSWVGTTISESKNLKNKETTKDVIAFKNTYTSYLSSRSGWLIEFMDNK